MATSLMDKASNAQGNNDWAKDTGLETAEETSTWQGVGACMVSLLVLLVSSSLRRPVLLLGF